MTRGRILLFVAALAVAAGLVAAWIQPAKPKEEAPSTRITQLLEGIVVPRVEVSGLTIVQAVETLNRYAAAVEPFRTDPPFVLWKWGDPIPPGMEALSESPMASRDEEGVTINLTAIPLTEVARYFTGLAGYSYYEAGGHLVVYPTGALNIGLVTREFYLLSSQEAEFGLWVPAGSASGRIDVRTAIEAQGVRFAPGSYAYYEPRDMRVVVHITADQAEFLDDLIFGGGCTGIAAAPSRWERTKIRASYYWYGISSYFPWSSPP